jgi:hypothetical protein
MIFFIPIFYYHKMLSRINRVRRVARIARRKACNKLRINPRQTKYLGWMALNSWSSSVNSVIATNSMLGSIIGTSPSYCASITTTYVGKDVVGQLGGLVYAWKTGNKADSEPMKYVTKGVSMQQMGCYLENASLLFTAKFPMLAYLGVSSVIKNVSFISIGAVNAQNIQKISDGSVGEFYTKVASVNTLAATLGMLTGVGVIHFLPSYTLRSLLVMPAMSAISIYSIRKATEIANKKNLS